MEFLNKAKNRLILSVLGLFLTAFSPLVSGMQPVPIVDRVAMDCSCCRYIYGNDHYKIWTNGLEGCVTTIIDIEYNDGNHAICMGHYAYFAKDDHKRALEDSLKMNPKDLKNIKKASCFLIPPGIYKNSSSIEIIPIIDHAWQDMIINTIKHHISAAQITIKPYLFNSLKSQVHYSYAAGKTALEIINGSVEMDEENKDNLLETHNYNAQDSQFKASMAAIILAALVGFGLYTSIA